MTQALAVVPENDNDLIRRHKELEDAFWRLVQKEQQA